MTHEFEEDSLHLSQSSVTTIASHESAGVVLLDSINKKVNPLSLDDLHIRFNDSVRNEQAAAAKFLVQQGSLLLEILKQMGDVREHEVPKLVSDWYAIAKCVANDEEIKWRCTFVHRLWESKDSPIFDDLMSLLAMTCVSTIRFLFQRCSGTLMLVYYLLKDCCHTKDDKEAWSSLSKGEVEIGLLGWRQSHFNNIVTKAQCDEICKEFTRKVKTAREEHKADLKQRQCKRKKDGSTKKSTHSKTPLVAAAIVAASAATATEPSSVPRKRQRTTATSPSQASAAVHQDSSIIPPSNASAATTLYNILPFNACTVLAADAHFHCSTVKANMQPNHLLSNSLSPFLGRGYRYLRDIPFAPINYKLATITPHQADQQYHGSWISWNQQQENVIVKDMKQRDEASFWMRVRDGNTTHLHFKDMEQWYHSKHGALDEQLKFGQKEAQIQRIHNPWRYAQIEKKVDAPQHGFDAVELQFGALNILSDQTSSLVEPDTANLLRLGWKHRKCDRGSHICNASPSAPNEHDRFIPDCTVFHPANLSYLPAHPKNLMCILSQKCTFTWIRKSDGKTVEIGVSMFDFSGITSSSWYVKCGDDFFYLHIEQLSMWFANFCHEGAMRWYFIPWTNLDGIVRAMLKSLARELDSSHDNKQVIIDSITALAADSKAEPHLRNLVRMLILGKRCLPHIDDLKAEGVQVDIVDQYAGQLIIGDGIVFHQGRSLTPNNIHEAINFIPDTWLLRGLPEFLATLQDFEQFPAAFEAINSDIKWAWLCKKLKKESFLFAHVLVPMEWSFCFLSLLHADLQAHISMQESRFNYSNITISQCKIALQQIDSCISLLCDSDELYRFYKLSWPNDKTLQDEFRMKKGSVSVQSINKS